MGGHGGLNILPQKRWNVYREDNKAKVRKDEEAAAKEEQLKREQSRKRDSEFRLERLRVARGIPPPPPPSSSQSPDAKSTTNHINLFENLKDFPSLEEDSQKKKRKFKKEEPPPPKVVSAEDEKFRLGYGIAGKGVKAPWYLSKPSFDDANAQTSSNRDASSSKQDGVKKSGKKTIQELREERLNREKREKERERALLSANNSHRGGAVPRPTRFSRY